MNPYLPPPSPDSPSIEPTKDPDPLPMPPLVGVMDCPACGHQMPDLRGGSTAICPICGFKDSCCF